MKPILFLSGAAGTGKTHNLISCIKDWVRTNPLKEHQRILAITRLHGSRKRLVERFKSECPGLRYEISTIDSFCFSLVSRTRKSHGIHRTIIPTENNGSRKEVQLGTQLSLSEIPSLAAKVVSSKVYGQLIGSAYPLIAIDEFQDNSGPILDFIKCLSQFSELILAADHFQSLNCDSSATNWVEALATENKATKIELRENHRCKNSNILEVALAIRTNAPLSTSKIAFYHSAKYAMASWKLLLWRNQAGTSAIISPSMKDLDLLLENASNQLEKQKLAGKRLPILPKWAVQKGRKEIEKEVIDILHRYVMSSVLPPEKKFKDLIIRFEEIIKATGIERHNQEIIEYVASEFALKRNHSSGSGYRYELLTIHSAKNREFDNVIVFWPINRMNKWSDEEKRRLLYNSITRARYTCEVVALGPVKEIQACPVLSLLGTAKPQFEKRK